MISDPRMKPQIILAEAKTPDGARLTLHSHDGRYSIRVNGKETDRFATNNMIFDTATYIAEVSKYCTIEPGDVMWMGTDGVPENIKPGDVVDIEITNIGTLTNPVVLEK